MAKKLSARPEDKLNTPNDFIAHAARGGAKIKPSENYTKIKTKDGCVSIKPSNEKLEPEDKRNYVRWFKLMGLLSLIGAGFLIWFFSNYHIIW